VRVTDAGHRFTMLNAEPADRQSTQCAPRRRLKDETGAMMAIDTLLSPDPPMRRPGASAYS
jgi:hypothetical protein